jgi:2-oxo-3-hexenedioate decarboxylase
MTIDVRALATRLDVAVTTATPVAQLTDEHPLSLDEAYAVQRAGVALREARGDRQVGVKLGFTSKAKAEQMGVSDVIVGVVTEQMHVEDGAGVDVGRMVHPRIEPEVAYRLGRAVDPSDPDSDIASAVDAVAPALEIIDSRYRDFRFRLEDVVADNTSAAAFVIGPWQEPGLDLSDQAVELRVDGTPVETGSTSAILGHPDRALDAVLRMAAQHGIELPAGTILLAGAATAAVPLVAGVVVEASIAGLGTVSVTAKDGSRA